jgi:hypothetical protein
MSRSSFARALGLAAMVAVSITAPAGQAAAATSGFRPRAFS